MLRALLKSVTDEQTDSQRDILLANAALHYVARSKINHDLDFTGICKKINFCGYCSLK